MICSFINEYKFLSPRSKYKVEIENLVFNHLEDLIYACLVVRKEDTNKFTNLENPVGNKYFKKFWLRGDWERISKNVVFCSTFQKFYQNKELIDKLLKTGNENLLYVNPFDDKLLGVSGEGSKDLLGEALVKTRKVFASNVEEKYNELTYDYLSILINK